MLGPRPGDEFEIKLGRKYIRLVPVGWADEDEWAYSLNMSLAEQACEHQSLGVPVQGRAQRVMPSCF